MATRYFFHLVKDGERIADRVGAEATEDMVMSPAALEIARDIWPGMIDLVDVGDREGWSLEIADPSGRVVRTIAFV